MKFIDRAEVTVRGGKGGAGALSFRREPYVPQGGPDGGDGGKGGDVIALANAQLATLEDITVNRLYKAENGSPGEGGRRSGKSGKDYILELPAGTVIRDTANGAILADLIEGGERVIVAKGGRGGRGNRKFATPTNRAPRKFEPGLKGEERRLTLDLKLIADVGLVGKPNAGKSTLLTALTSARPKIASYPFTTLTPALGIVQTSPYSRFVMADIPGLIEGAQHGKGLGHQFLRHIERTRLIVLMIEAPEEDYSLAVDQLLVELDGYEGPVSGLPRITILSKCDLPRGDEKNRSVNFDLEISSINGEGLEELVTMIDSKLKAEQESQVWQK